VSRPALPSSPLAVRVRQRVGWRPVSKPRLCCSVRASTESRETRLHPSVVVATSKFLQLSTLSCRFQNDVVPARALCRFDERRPRSPPLVPASPFRGLPPRHSTAALVAPWFPPCRFDSAAHRASSAATTFVFGFEVLIRGEIASSTARLPLDGFRSPLRVFPSLGGLPTPRCPGSPARSAHGFADVGLQAHPLRSPSASY
jgi:hypothetical protein